MSRITDLTAIAVIARHCQQPGCGKCAARSRWNRRKRQRPGNPPARKNTRKEVMR